MKNNPESGFTLIEVAIVMIILGVLVAGVTAFFISRIQQINLAETNEKLASIDDALQAHLEINGFYPCAAPMNAQPETADFGRAVDCSAAAVAGETEDDASNRTVWDPTSGAPADTDIRIGSVPTRTLNLPDDYAFDAWGGRFTYAISETLAVAGQYDRQHGGVSINDSAGNSVVTPADGAHYALLSHGESGMGVVPRNGGARLEDCTITTELDSENCDDDSEFIDTVLASDQAGANFYDDLVFRTVSNFVTTPANAVVAFNLPDCPAGWTLYTPAEGRFIIGTGQYAPGAGVYVSDGTGGLNWAPNAHDFGLEDNDEGNESYLVARAELPDQLTAVEVDPAVGPAAARLTVAQITATVNQEPTNNLPPFVALRYCEKQ
ncbi:MAG: type II secretion system protein [Pseudomonadota bacterium]